MNHVLVSVNPALPTRAYPRLRQAFLQLVSACQWVLLQFPILIALQALLPYQMLLAALHQLAYIVVRLDVLYPLEYLLVFFEDVVELTDAHGMVQGRHDLVGSVVRARLGGRLEVPLPLGH